MIRYTFSLLSLVSVLGILTPSTGSAAEEESSPRANTHGQNSSPDGLDTSGPGAGTPDNAETGGDDDLDQAALYNEDDEEALEKETLNP